MRHLVAALSLSLALFSACGSDDEVGESDGSTPASTIETPAPILSPVPTVTPTSHPTGVGQEPEGFESFRSFGTDVSAAINASDPEFFIGRAVEAEEVCRGDEQLGPCADAPAGTVRRGIPGSAWRSDAWAIFSKDDYEANLRRYFDAAIDSAQDGFGTGDLRLFALAGREEEGRRTFMAISTAILDIYPSTGYPIGRSEREAHVFQFEEQEQGWGFVGERAAVVSVTAVDWLSGTCTECYDYWEPWQGATE